MVHRSSNAGSSPPQWTGHATQHVIGLHILHAGHDVGRDALMQPDRDLNRMYEERVSADDDIAELTSVDVAHACLVKARRFLATCSGAFGDRLDKSGYR
jgi:hypothetical protein